MIGSIKQSNIKIEPQHMQCTTTNIARPGDSVKNINNNMLPIEQELPQIVEHFNSAK